MNDKAKALALRDQGRSARQIAAELKIPLSTVGEWLAAERRVKPHQPRSVHSYKVVGVAQKKGETPASYRISVPPHIGVVIPPDVEFIPELVEDGILFRRVDRLPEPELPSWVTS